MSHWKFLRRGARSPFVGFDWSARIGDWVTADAADPCRAGIHACTAEQLPYWIADELWEIELDGAVAAGAHKVVAPRARLVRQVEAWNADSATDLKSACIARTAGHAAAELTAAGLDDEARRMEAARAAFAAAPDAAALRAVGEACAAAALGRRQANLLARYLVDAIDAATVHPVALIAYIAARAANQRTVVDSDDPFAAERAWQAVWLRERLGLPTDA